MSFFCAFKMRFPIVTRERTAWASVQGCDAVDCAGLGFVWVLEIGFTDITPIIQMEKNLQHEMETGGIWGL